MNTFTLTDPQTGAAVEYQSEPICGFWRRIWALFFDALFLGLVGCTLSLCLTAQFVQMGWYGRLVGLGVMLAYFGILNSRIGKGQSIGKRLLHIKVVNQAGEYISPAESFGRSLIMGLPFFLNGIMLPPSSLTLVISGVIGFLAFGLALPTLYLYLCNRKSRQTIHDLICRTYVVRESLSGPVYTEPIAKIHFGVVAAIVTLGIALPFALYVRTPRSVNQLFDLQEKLMRAENILYATVNEGVNYGHGKTVGFIEANVFIKNPVTTETEINAIARNILRVPGFAKKDYVGVTTSYGYDIGIWSYYVRKRNWYTLQEWQERFK